MTPRWPAGGLTKNTKNSENIKPRMPHLPVIRRIHALLARKRLGRNTTFSNLPFVTTHSHTAFHIYIYISEVSSGFRHSHLPPHHHIRIFSIFNIHMCHRVCPQGESCVHTCSVEFVPQKPAQPSNGFTTSEEALQYR